MRLSLSFFIFSLALVGEEKSRDIDCTCGNGTQDVIPKAVNSCPYLLYGATANGPTSVSNLLALNPYDGTGFVIAPISSNLRAVTAMDFSPTGVLYAVGKNVSNQPQFATIDCLTGQATIIGSPTIPGSGVTGINFDSQGRLWAHVTGLTQQGARQDGILGQINIATGAFTQVGNTFLNNIGNGIAFANFPNSVLFHAGEINLNTLSQINGLASSVDGLDFSLPAINRPRINDMDFDPLKNIMYAALNDKPSGQNSQNINYLSTVDLLMGTVSFVKIPVQLAPSGLSAICFNRQYETCDSAGVGLNDPPLPEGSSCSSSCGLVETICSDGVDNDLDGLIDCGDSDCNNLPCNSGGGCSADLCTGGTCIGGAPLDCNDNNVCTNDSCVQSSCINEIDTNNPCTDFNPCTTDSCDLSGDCLSVNLPNGTSCDDESPCTLNDECQDGQCIGTVPAEICNNGVDDDCDTLVDGADPDCAGSSTIEVECGDGLDNDGDLAIDCADSDCNDLECEDDANPCTDDVCIFGFCDHSSDDSNTCTDNNPCTNDVCFIGDCVSTNNSNSCNDSNACTENDTCALGICQGAPIVCDDLNECTNDICIGGSCSFVPLNGNPCTPDENECTDDVCSGGICSHNNNDANSCSDGLSCTSGDHCDSGTCVGTAGSETGANCTNGVDDDCDFLIDQLDSNCQSIWLRVFVTSTTYQGDFGGSDEEDDDNFSAKVTDAAAAADAICQARAIAASRTGTFRAFISTSTSSAASRITNPNNKPWYLYSGIPNRIADNLSDLLDGTIQQAINVDEFGQDVSTSTFAWTGSEASGLVSSRTCKDWTSSSSGDKGYVGSLLSTDSKWAKSKYFGCNKSYRLYCFQIE